MFQNVTLSSKNVTSMFQNVTLMSQNVTFTSQNVTYVPKRHMYVSKHHIRLKTSHQSPKTSIKVPKITYTSPNVISPDQSSTLTTLPRMMTAASRRRSGSTRWRLAGSTTAIWRTSAGPCLTTSRRCPGRRRCGPVVLKNYIVYISEW